MNNQRWKDIKGYEGLYMVSDTGLVKSLERVSAGVTKRGTKVNRFVKEKIKTMSPDKCGYLLVQLSKNNIPESFLVHRLVAFAFIPNPKNYSQVNHKDEIKSNNCVENLEWCTPKQNTNYGTGLQRRSKALRKIVIQEDLEGNFINEYRSITDTVNYGFRIEGVSSCCRGRIKSHAKYRWRFKNDKNIV